MSYQEHKERLLMVILVPLVPCAIVSFVIFGGLVLATVGYLIELITGINGVIPGAFLMGIILAMVYLLDWLAT